MKSITVTATTRYMNLEGGFWGLVANENYLPVNFPEQLKTDGIKASCRIVLLNNTESAFGWGTPCRILSFKTLAPFTA